MPLYLLTHQRELERPSNTGRLVLDELAQYANLQVIRLQWQRKNPDPHLVQLAEQQKLWLLYPASELTEAVVRPEPLCWASQHWVLLDATWQESQKMLRQSPYLQQAKRLSLPASHSAYLLRRNQQAGALCTAEVAVQLLALSGWPEQSAALAQRFRDFNHR